MVSAVQAQEKKSLAAVKKSVCTCQRRQQMVQADEVL